MDVDLSSVPDDIEALKAGLIASRAETAAVGAELASARAATANDRSLIAYLKLEIEKLRRALHGPRSERTARLLDQLELQLEKAEADATEDCPSSDDLRHIAGFRKGGSGSSVIEIMRHSVDAASDGLRLSGA